eukprot:gene9782-25958_t
MGPWINDLGRYDGTDYDENERQVRFLWATDGTLCQYKNEHRERANREGIASIARLHL